MSMQKCKECGNAISSKAESCPHCGNVIKKKRTSIDQLFYGVVIIMVMLVLFSIKCLLFGE